MKSYDNGSLVSSKYITSFSDFRWEDASDNHPPIPEYLNYLHQYCEEFDLYQFIYFDTQIVNIDKHRQNNNILYSVQCKYLNDRYNNTNIKKYLSKKKFNAIACCSGLHNVPYIPTINGLDSFKGKVMHSSQYKKKSIFKPDFCAVKLDADPWIVQPFEIYEEIRIEEIKKKHQK